MSYESLINIIVKQIGKVAEKYAPDKDVVVCPERIFVDDYLPKEEQYVAVNGQLPSLDQDDPNEPPYADKVFVVVKLGSGQKNMAVSNSIVTIQVLSENNDFVAARDILDSFSSEYNFKYEDGIVQAYFTPEVAASQESIYTGFRALLSIRGFVRVPEEGFAFADAMYVTVGEYGIRSRIPFMNYSYNYTAQPDPQAFAGTQGQTMALNRQSTETVSFSTYLQFGQNAPYNDFSHAVLEARNHLNRKVRIEVRSNLDDVTLIDEWFVLSGIHYEQELGDMAPWLISFTRAKMIED